MRRMDDYREINKQHHMHRQLYRHKLWTNERKEGEIQVSGRVTPVTRRKMWSETLEYLNNQRSICQSWLVLPVDMWTSSLLSVNPPSPLYVSFRSQVPRRRGRDACKHEIPRVANFISTEPADAYFTNARLREKPLETYAVESGNQVNQPREKWQRCEIGVATQDHNRCHL